jgi:crotonobetainyl-CoA:carnitine CoA-transferase CaiB-like acyl-CoA transferase
MSALPLEGIVVLEFTHVVMGPACGVVMADLGADVIRVEPAPYGDPTRAPRGTPNGSYFYFNRNKRAISVDLKKPEGHAVAVDLVRKADVLVENFGPGTMTRLGLGWRAVHEINPRLIYLTLKGFLPGPYEHRPALDEVAQMMTGLAYMTGPPGQPLRAGASVVDMTGGIMGVVGVLSALLERAKDGRGRKISSSLFESCAFLIGQHMAGEAVTGQPAKPMPARTGAWAIYQIFPTGDGRSVYIAVTSDNQWQSFCKHFNRPDLANDARYMTNPLRVEHGDALRAAVAELCQQHDLDTMCRTLEAARVPFSPVRSPSDMFGDPQLEAHDRALPIRMPGGRVAKLPALPIAIDDHTPKLRRQPPELGEHTSEILAELGYDAARIATLREGGAVR